MIPQQKHENETLNGIQDNMCVKMQKMVGSCSLKFSAHVNMFWEHQENEKMRQYSGTCFCCHHRILKCYLLLNPKSFLYRIFEISLTWFLLLFVVKERCKHDLALSNQKICHGALLHYQLSQFASISMINNDYDFHLQNYCEITFI